MQQDKPACDLVADGWVIVSSETVDRREDPLVSAPRPGGDRHEALRRLYPRGRAPPPLMLVELLVALGIVDRLWTFGGGEERLDERRPRLVGAGDVGGACGRSTSVGEVPPRESSLIRVHSLELRPSEGVTELLETGEDRRVPSPR